MKQSLLSVSIGILAFPGLLFAGAWTLPQGTLWTKAAVFQQSTRESYLADTRLHDGVLFHPGDRLTYPFEGEFDATAVYVDLIYGVTDRFDLGVQIPYLDRAYADTTRPESPAERGLGDIRIAAKWRVLKDPAQFSIKLGAKMPNAEFSNQDGLIPVGEGQWDFDFVGQLGKSFWPLPLYVNLDLGYRVRTVNEQRTIQRDPGDEWFFTAEAGYNLTSRLLLIGKYELLRSDPATDFGFLVVESQIKQITYFTPTLVYKLSERLTVELAVPVSLSGRNFPAGHQLVFGLSSHVDALHLIRRLR